MSKHKGVRILGGLALAAAFCGASARGQQGDQGQNQNGSQINHVFVIALENHNWTQPVQVPGGIEQVFQNPNAPFINSLVDGTAVAYINGQLVNVSNQVSYAAAYHNVLATPSGSNPHIHPSEPNYLWAEAGTNFGIFNDDDPYKDNPPNAQSTTQHLTGLLQLAGISWKSYQEDIDLMKDAGGLLVDIPGPREQRVSPIVSFQGFFAPESPLNEYNASNQFNYAVKHNPMAFFTDTNGGNDTSTTNPLAKNYAPLQQLANDLAQNNVADYVWITPNQYNDMHTGLKLGFDGLTGDASNIRQGDQFLSRIVPVIMASQAYQNGGVIILWWDESEADMVGDNGDDFNHTIGEIVISPLAHENVGGLPYASAINLTHSSDLRTMQEIFHVKASGASPFLGDAVNATDLSDLFRPGVIPRNP